MVSPAAERDPFRAFFSSMSTMPMRPIRAPSMQVRSRWRSLGKRRTEIAGPWCVTRLATSSGSPTRSPEFSLLRHRISVAVSMRGMYSPIPYVGWGAGRNAAPSDNPYGPALTGCRPSTDHPVGMVDRDRVPGLSLRFRRRRNRRCEARRRPSRHCPESNGSTTSCRRFVSPIALPPARCDEPPRLGHDHLGAFGLAGAGRRGPGERWPRRRARVPGRPQRRFHRNIARPERYLNEADRSERPPAFAGAFRGEARSGEGQ